VPVQIPHPFIPQGVPYETTSMIGYPPIPHLQYSISPFESIPQHINTSNSTPSKTNQAQNVSTSTVETAENTEPDHELTGTEASKERAIRCTVCAAYVDDPNNAKTNTCKKCCHLIKAHLKGKSHCCPEDKCGGKKKFSQCPTNYQPNHNKEKVDEKKKTSSYIFYLETNKRAV